MCIGRMTWRIYDEMRSRFSSRVECLLRINESLQETLDDLLENVPGVRDYLANKALDEEIALGKRPVTNRTL